jgi:ElaB/YqjD/DUF883 family membrane-anchored ribosome-binding protein
VAEERSPIAAPAGSPGAVPDPAEPGATQEIREQIERTREDMGRTIDELQERLSPEHVMQQAKDTLHDATVGRVKQMVNTASETARETAAEMAERAQGTAHSVADEARAHPVSAVLLGAGAAWLLSSTSLFRRHPDRWSDDAEARRQAMRRRTRTGAYATSPFSDRSSNFEGEYDMSNGYGYGQRSWTDIVREHPVPTALAVFGIGYLAMQRDSGSRSRGAWSTGDDGRSMRRAAEGMGEKVNEWGEQLSDGVRRAGAQARESAEELGEQVQGRWQETRRRTSSEFDEWMDSSPLAVGAVALAVGLALGFSTPRTRVEDEYMGPARDALVERGTEAAEDAVHEVQERMTDATASATRQDTPGMRGQTPGTARPGQTPSV